MHKRMAIISDNLLHGTDSIYEYQTIILKYLKLNFDVKKVYYFSNGANSILKIKINYQIFKPM